MFSFSSSDLLCRSGFLVSKTSGSSDLLPAAAFLSQNGTPLLLDDASLRTALGIFKGASGSTKLPSALGAEAAFSGLDLDLLCLGLFTATLVSFVLLLFSFLKLNFSFLKLNLRLWMGMGTSEFSACEEGGGFGTIITVAVFFLGLSFLAFDLTCNKKL